MKTKLLFTTLLSFIFCLLSSQVPQGFNYQAIARDGSGNPITNATIRVKLSILTDTTGFFASGTGTYLWEEEQTDIKTNAFGLFIVVFGKLPASKVQGSAASFSAIDWAKTPLFIGTKIANPTNYKNLGTAKLWSVPYSMVADSTKSLLKGAKLTVVSADDGATDALFEVKRKDGQTVFAVYPDAVNICIPRHLTKSGTKGGFAIGSFDSGLKSNPTQDYFRVTPDSVRIYIDKTPVLAKGSTKGGFAIGGFDQSKGGGGGKNLQDLLTVSNDSIRLYIDNVGTKTTKGGFAIGGFEVAKGAKYNYLKVDETKIKGGKTDFMKLTSLNTFIGDSSGYKNVPSGDNGSYNNFIGYKSGYSNYSGHHNTYIGWKSGFNVGPNAHYNIAIGNMSGYNNTGSSNVFIGDNSGYRNYSGTQNVFIGALAGKMNRTGNSNMFIGSGAGRRDSSGYGNTFLGTAAGEWTIVSNNNTYIGYVAGDSNDGSSNVMIGNEAGLLLTGGANNVFIGVDAGYDNSVAVGVSNSVFIGYKAGYYETGSNKLFIDNAPRSGEADARVKALVYGVFAANPMDQRFTLNAILKLTPLASAPTPAEDGMIYINSTNNHIYCYIASTWKQLDN